MGKLKKAPIGLSEKGKTTDEAGGFFDRRLFVQFLGFGDIDPALESSLIDDLEKSSIPAVFYLDVNDYRGAGLLTMADSPDFFVDDIREFLANSTFSRLRLKPEYTMFGRTYPLGYEKDLEESLILNPMRRILDPELKWAIWYPLRRAKIFETLTSEEQKAVLMEHGKVGFSFGDAGYAKDIRLASYGLDKNDNDFVIGILGKELYPLSALIEAMRKTKQTSMYLESLGPFFIGKKVFSSKQVV